VKSNRTGWCIGVIKRKLEGSSLRFEELAWKEISLYLRYNLQQEQVTKCIFKEYLPIRRYNRRPPIFTRSGSKDNLKIRYQPWVFPPHPPDEATTRKMFCEAVGVMIKRTMELHDFQLDGTIYRQSKGGAIGMDLTGVVSDIYTCEWDQGVLEGMERAGMNTVMYKRYKDDVNVILEVEKESETVTDGEVMDRVKLIANGVDENLKVTTDCGDNYENKRVPVLDLEVWIGRNERNETPVLYSHCRETDLLYIFISDF
jgi:hypothetical protein